MEADVSLLYRLKIGVFVAYAMVGIIGAVILIDIILRDIYGCT